MSALPAPDRNAFVVDVCVAMLTAPALRHQLMLAESPERAQLLVEFPPAMVTEDILLSATRIALAAPHPPLALAPLLPRDEAMAVASAELRLLTSWGEKAGRAMLDAAQRLSVARQETEGSSGKLHPAEGVVMYPYVLADGSIGFRNVEGGGFGFGDWHSSTNRMAR